MAWRKLLKIFVPETLMIGGAFDIIRKVGDFQSTNPFSNPSTQSEKVWAIDTLCGLCVHTVAVSGIKVKVSKKFQNENLGLFQSIKPGREPLHQEMGRARAAVGLVTEPFYFAC